MKTKTLHEILLHNPFYCVVFRSNYSVWKDRINVVAVLYDGLYWSVGLYFRVCLK